MRNSNVDLDDYVSLVVPYTFNNADLEPPTQTALEIADGEINHNLSRLTRFLRRANNVLNKRE
ncbi:hypothetical protein [Halotia branconii]|uniref:Uncharacterized protein n=1 Tax=Halotia branconii CENA392 TaxID=1539056 RepID=A0AAJ6NS36_9CYAN|nr:hypothetical protein [Halotia branconii]WGV25675.1 hypothetical protein QI031_28810 [Halotia branconii CENA392]